MDIVVIDDSAVMRAMVIRSLKLCGLRLGRIHEAADGCEGLAVLGRHRVDLALLDLNMPIMDGWEMLRRVRANPRTARLPVLVVSSECAEAGRERLSQWGAAFVHKPFSPRHIAQCIQGVMPDADFSGFSDLAAPPDGGGDF
jgi:two-component system chemotaxis response regulator CheY